MGEHDAEYYSAIIRKSLHLPKSTISIVPYNFTSSPNSRTLDIKALDRMVADDTDCGKLPILILANVGKFDYNSYILPGH